MVTVIRRIAVLFAVLALLTTQAARAGTTTYTAPYQMGPSGGDDFNYVQADPSTGEMTIARVNPTPVNSTIFCIAQGGFANFEVSHNASALTSVVVHYSSALLDAYSWVNVGVRQGDGFLASRAQRGVIAGDGMVTVTLQQPAAGPIVVWFGLQVPPTCLSASFAHATFTSVAMVEA